MGPSDDGVAPPRASVPGAPRRALGRRHRSPEWQDRSPNARTWGAIDPKPSKDASSLRLVDTLGQIGAVVVMAAHGAAREGLVALVNQ